jgi:uncharacterized protein YjiS (DUF1127 family)
MLLKRFKTGSIPKLLLTYLVEVIIIFLGITISFLFEQWREEARQKKELIELSESLLADIDALKAKLADDRSGSSAWISQLDSLRIQRSSGEMSERHLTWFHKMITGQFVFLFDPYSPTYMSAAGSGLVHELPDSIRNQLYDLYRVQLPFFQLLYDQQQANVTNFRNQTLVPANTYLYRTEPSAISPDLNMLFKEIQRPVYGNFINQVIITEKKVYEMNKDAFDTLIDLQGSLRNYIDAVKK